eukprot:scaffold325843_cov104-Tisochrysis_lutea.AAC.1
MARAACVGLTAGAGKGAMLNRVFFLQPLVLSGDLSHVQVTVNIMPDERFDVNSEDTENATKKSHCAGSHATYINALHNFSHAALRASCAQPVGVAAIYSTFRSVGLEYGPLYRTLTSARVSREVGVAVGQLRRRSHKEG